MKNILLTGIKGQLGQAIKFELLRQNHRVLGLDLKKDKNFKNNYNYVVDITKENDVKKFFKKLNKEKITIDIVINNAGIGAYGNIKYRKEKEIIDVMNVNLLGAINLIKHFKFSINNKKKLYKIINISSLYGFSAPKFEIYKRDDRRYSSEIYSATKAGLIQITKYFAKNFDGLITVNSVSPGGIINTTKQSKIFIREYSKNVPLKRMANVEDIVKPILFLCSEDSNYINGHNLVIDGGLSC